MRFTVFILAALLSAAPLSTLAVELTQVEVDKGQDFAEISLGIEAPPVTKKPAA